MNSARDRNTTQRNITPSFVRFKRKNSNAKQTNEENNRHDVYPTDRSTSKVSRCSFEVYEKRVLNLSKLKANLNLRKRNEENVGESLKKKVIEIHSKRTASNEKEEIQRENCVTQLSSNEKGLIRKSFGGSGKVLKPYSRDKHSTSKRTQESLEKEQQRAKLMNVNLINNLMTTNNAPNYMNKLKIKKHENQEKKKVVKKKILNCDVEIKGQETIRYYQIFGQLGKGAYGIVKMGLDKRTGNKVAIKVYEKKKLDEINKIRNLERQINILSMLDHPVIAKLIQTIETSTEIFLILEYGGANSLYNYLLSKPEHRLQQSEAKQFFKTIAQTIKYLHDQNIVHRDIKAENILLNRHKQLKLIDFGFSLESKPPQTIDTFCGTPTYMAPEIVSKRDHVPVYTDMWSLGILYYVMLQGNYPFRAKSQNQLFDKIKKGNFEYLHNDISLESKHLLENLIKVNHRDRLNIKQITTQQYQNWYDNY